MSRMRISSAADFPNLIVYEQPGRMGPTCSIAFRNLEMGSTAELVIRGTTGVILFGAAVLLGIPLIGVAYGIHPLLALVAVMALAAGYPILKPVLSSATLVEREIELNPDDGVLRVYKRGRPEIERRLSSLANLTIEPHPAAEFKRMARMDKNEKRLYAEEKTHCLFGWFGEGGAEKVMLVPRVEWPSNQSLFEVRQAIIWALDRVAAPARDAVSADEAADGVGPYKPATPAKPGPGGGGIKPPLD